MVNGSTEQVQELIACSLQEETIMEQLEKTKRYELLPFFLPLFSADKHERRRDRFCRMYARALVENDKKSARLLDEHLQFDAQNAQKIAFYCGQLTKTGRLFKWVEYNYPAETSYLFGLISQNNLDLYLETRQKQTYNIDANTLDRAIYFYCGEHSAYKAMDHFGFETDKLECYVRGAMCGHQKECLEFLFNKAPAEVNATCITELQCLSTQAADFVRHFLKQGLLQLSNKDWLWLQGAHEELYLALQSDV